MEGVNRELAWKWSNRDRNKHVCEMPALWVATYCTVLQCLPQAVVIELFTTKIPTNAVSRMHLDRKFLER